MSYSAYITRITKVRKHPNADRLLLGDCFGNQVVVGLDTKEGDIGIYFPTDGKLSQDFLKANNLIGTLNPDGTRSGGFFDEKGKVRTQKFRKEKSDGYFCGIQSVAYTGVDVASLVEGTLFTSLNGQLVCEKYVTERTRRAVGEKKKAAPKVRFPVFHEHIDTEQLAYNIGELKEGDRLIITEKLHGTSQRTSHTIKTQQTWYGQLINGFFKREVVAPIREWTYACGTRRVIIDTNNLGSGYYGTNEGFRKTAHEMFIGKLEKGETVYYEIVGWQNKDTPLMPAADNKKLNDKDFVKAYGKQTIFHYGQEPGTIGVYVYRMTTTNEDGIEIDYDWELTKKRCKQMAVNFVPEKMIISHYSGEGKKFVETLSDYVSDTSVITPAHIMEGVVVRRDGSKWAAWKHKSFEFKVLEGIIKDTGVVDTEESA